MTINSYYEHYRKEAGSWIYGNGVGCEGERRWQLEADVTERHNLNPLVPPDHVFKWGRIFSVALCHGW